MYAVNVNASMFQFISDDYQTEVEEKVIKDKLGHVKVHSEKQ